jgi:hypothetical protein
MLVGANDRGAINGRGVGVSPDGEADRHGGWVGWSSKSDPRRQCVIPVFESEDIETLVGQIEVGAYPIGVAFDPRGHWGAPYRGGGAHHVIVFNPKSLATKGSFPLARTMPIESVFLGFGGGGERSCAQR